MRLKSWESPRHEGRNTKGKGGAARARQLRKQQQMLRKQLKSNSKQEKGISVPFFFYGLANCSILFQTRTSQEIEEAGVD